MLVTELVTPSYADRPGKANRLSGNPPFLHVLFKDSHKCFGVLQGLFCLTDYFFFFHSCSFLNVFLFPLGESNVDATRNPTESFCALPCMLPIASPTIASPNKAIGATVLIVGMWISASAIVLLSKFTPKWLCPGGRGHANRSRRESLHVRPVDSTWKLKPWQSNHQTGCMFLSTIWIYCDRYYIQLCKLLLWLNTQSWQQLSKTQEFIQLKLAKTVVPA